MKKLIILVIVVGIIAAVAKLAQAKKAEWHGLTESQVRDKLNAKLSDRIPEDKKSKVEDAIVNKMRARGVLHDQDTGVATA